MVVTKKKFNLNFNENNNQESFTSKKRTFKGLESGNNSKNYVVDNEKSSGNLNDSETSESQTKELKTKKQFSLNNSYKKKPKLKRTFLGLKLNFSSKKENKPRSLINSFSSFESIEKNLQEFKKELEQGSASFNSFYSILKNKIKGQDEILKSVSEKIFNQYLKGSENIQNQYSVLNNADFSNQYFLILGSKTSDKKSIVLESAELLGLPVVKNSCEDLIFNKDSISNIYKNLFLKARDKYISDNLSSKELEQYNKADNNLKKYFNKEIDLNKKEIEKYLFLANSVEEQALIYAENLGIIILEDIDNLNKNKKASNDFQKSIVEQIINNLIIDFNVDTSYSENASETEKKYMRTSNVLVFLNGSFNGIESLISKRLIKEKSIDSKDNIEEVLKHVDERDLIEYGLNQEFVESIQKPFYVLNSLGLNDKKEIVMSYYPELIHNLNNNKTGSLKKFNEINFESDESWNLFVNKVASSNNSYEIPYFVTRTFPNLLDKYAVNNTKSKNKSFVINKSVVEKSLSYDCHKFD